MDARTPALAILYAFAAAMALPLETVMLPLLAGAFFEEAAYPRALELFVSVCTAGFALGSPLMNLIFDLQGSYRPALIVAVLLMAGVTVTIQWVIARKEKNMCNIAGYAGDRQAAPHSDRDAPPPAGFRRRNELWDRHPP